MKQFLLFAATVLVTLGTISQAQAKKPEDQEFRRVIVTLTSGEKVDGYLQRSWHAESSVLKKGVRILLRKSLFGHKINALTIIMLHSCDEKYHLVTII